MTIEEATEEKENLRLKIQSLIEDFETDTGTTLTRLICFETRKRRPDRVEISVDLAENKWNEPVALKEAA